MRRPALVSVVFECYVLLLLIACTTPGSASQVVNSGHVDPTAAAAAGIPHRKLLQGNSQNARNNAPGQQRQRDRDSRSRGNVNRQGRSSIPGLPDLGIDLSSFTRGRSRSSGTGSSSSSADIASYVNAALFSSRADAAAQAITLAPARGEASATAVSIVEASADGRGEAVAESVAAAAAQNTAATASVLAQAAASAMRQGKGRSFGRSQARAFSKAKSKGSLRAFTTSVAEAINQGGNSAAEGYAAAIAEASANGGDDQRALAEATAVAFCSGGSTATAFASAYSIAISRNSQGCLVLTQARALAVARCGGGQFTAYAEASATSQALGLCGLKRREMSIPGINLPRFGSSFGRFGNGNGRR